MSKTDIKHMKLALQLAAKAKDKTYPNPMVGACLVKGEKVIARGYHHKAGSDHAEVDAIKNAHRKCSGATMFVTLEPCDHYGKTPPCTEAIISSGIKTVNIAMRDPNPINNGRGIKKLKNAGIAVNTGLCAEEAKELNRKYIKFIKTGLPYVTIKLAQSLDGKIAARNGTSKWISSPESRAYVKKIRHDFDAIAIGSGTLIKDNPFLLDEKRLGYNVTRIIIDTHLKISANSNIIKTANNAPVIIATTELAQKSKIKKLQNIKNVEIIVTKSASGRVSMKSFLTKLARKGILNVLVEGGGELVGNLIDRSLVDEAMFFISPILLGGAYSSVKGKGVQDISKAVSLRDTEITRIGRDILVWGRL